jgi:hypothetical protein
MIAKLDTEYAATLTIGLMVKRDKYHQFKYNPGGDFKKFIEIHKAKAKDFFDAGGVASELERVLQLHQSIPAEYDETLDWFEGLPEEKQIHNIYRAKILGKYKRRYKLRNK